MRKLLALYAMVGALSVVNVVGAQQAPAEAHGKKERPALTEEQKKLRSELLAKYDANKNGKLDQEEFAKVTPEDRKKLREAHLGPPNTKGGNKKEK